MRWHLATNNQLSVIIKHDKEIPAHLLSGVIHEALDRGMFDKVIYWVFDNLMKNWRLTVKAWNIENEDLLSMGYCGVLNALKRWEPGKTSFKSFAFMNIRSEFTHMLENENAKKRYINKITDSYDKENEFGVAIKELLPTRSNVEKEALKNIYFQSKMKVLASKEREVLHYFLQGYSLREVALQIFQLKSATMVYRYFNRALEKLGLSDFELRERNIG